MSTTKTATQNLATIVFESEQAAAEAAAAQAKAIAAAQKADEARRRVEEEQREANRRYLAVLEREYPERRDALTEVVGSTHAALVAAVTNGGNVTSAYLDWTRARVDLWALDQELHGQRGYLGRPARIESPPSFSFAAEVGQIVDHVCMSLVDDAQTAYQERRANYLAGKESV